MPALDHTALEIRTAAIEAATLSLLRLLRCDAEGYEVPGELSLTLQATSKAAGDTVLDLAVSLNERPVLGMSL